jgi:PD-(D/E)XK nuclease superfamily
MGERLLITTSEMRTFLRCPKEHQFRYGLGYKPHAKGGALQFGTAVHAGLEAWFLAAGEVWASGGEVTINERPLDAALVALASQKDLDPFDGARARAMLRGYHYRWGSDRYEVIAVEKEFRTPLTNPSTGEESAEIDLGGKMDGLVRDEHGRVWVLEHKTSSANLGFGEHYWLRLRHDLQCSVYMRGARSLGYEPVGVLYDVLGKPRIRPGKHETVEAFGERFTEELASKPADYYARAEVVRLEADEREAWRDIYHIATLIHLLGEADAHPRNTDSCERYGRLCEYFDPCTNAADIRDPLFFQRVAKHEELTNR